MLCQCDYYKKSPLACDNEIDTLQLSPQFLNIIKEYVKYHPEFDSYLVSSQFSLTRHTQREFNYNDSHKFYITPAVNRYCIEFSEDSVYTFLLMAEYLSSYFEINNKKVYLRSDADDLSKYKISIDSLKHKIVVKKSGGIWCFATKNNKYYIVSKDVERNESIWPGIIAVKSTVKFSMP